MRLTRNSSVKRRSKSTRRGPSSDSPAGCSMEPPPKMPQAAGNKTKFRRFAPAQCQSSAIPLTYADRRRNPAGNLLGVFPPADRLQAKVNGIAVIREIRADDGQPAERDGH